MQPNKQLTDLHEHMMICFILAMLGGYLDAYTYLLKGGVFANAQTGNLVLLFISSVHHDYSHVFKYMIPIMMFALGILLSEIAKSYDHLNRNNHRIKMVILIEAILLITIEVIGPVVSDHMINCMISFIAAIQVANFDKINGNPMATTMITGNLRSSMVQLNRYLQSRERKYLNRVINYGVVILGFGIGVMIGAIFSRMLGDEAILISLLFLTGAYMMLRLKEKRVQYIKRCV